MRRNVLPLLPVLAKAQSFAERCQNFNITIPGVEVNVLQFVANGTNVTIPDTDPTCAQSQVNYGGDLCRVALYVPTSDASGIHMEAWLPSDWNGRFLSAGNGGLNGCISWSTIAYATSYQFAAVGTNNGHNGTSGKPFLNAPEVVEDFAYRALHTGVVVGKELTTSFYEENINKSYYLGCSTGGRQGMKSAFKYPEDFDGIIAGAPARDFNDLNSWSYWLSYVAGFDNTSSSFIPRPLWTIINNEVIRQCDGYDGALDGIIEDTDMCTPKLETLLCGPNPANASVCLNQGQYERAVKLFEPLYYGPGNIGYPRLQPSAHAQAAAIYFNGRPFQYSNDWYKYAIYNNESLDVNNLGLEDFLYAQQLDLYNISTWEGDLTPFADRGGKLLTWHGLSDAVISSDNSGRYYNYLSQSSGLRPEQLDDFYRYFRVSGTAHCRGGVGANDIGQESYGRPAGVSTKENNILQAIVAWVEDGEAPEYVEGIKWVNDNPAQGKLFSRKHCRYPKRNVYKGTGNGTDVDGWECVF